MKRWEPILVLGNSGFTIKMHSLTGDEDGFFSIKAAGNWTLTCSEKDEVLLIDEDGNSDEVIIWSDIQGITDKGTELLTKLTGKEESDAAALMKDYGASITIPRANIVDIDIGPTNIKERNYSAGNINITVQGSSSKAPNPDEKTSPIRIGQTIVSSNQPRGRRILGEISLHVKADSPSSAKQTPVTAQPIQNIEEIIENPEQVARPDPVNSQDTLNVQFDKYIAKINELWEMQPNNTHAKITLSNLESDLNKIKQQKIPPSEKIAQVKLITRCVKDQLKHEHDLWGFIKQILNKIIQLLKDYTPYQGTLFTSSAVKQWDKLDLDDVPEEGPK